jgi:hypothetical protein
MPAKCPEADIAHPARSTIRRFDLQDEVERVAMRGAGPTIAAPSFSNLLTISRAMTCSSSTSSTGH